MVQYTDLALSSLIELLVKQIQQYDDMLSTRVFSVEEFAQCKQTLAELHAAIKEKAKEDGYPMDNVYPNFPDTQYNKSVSDRKPGNG